MIFYSDASQDKFVYSIYAGKKEGSFLDIGSCGAISSNNSFALESVGWKGACIEIEKSYQSTYSERNCLFINQNALSVNYSELLSKLSNNNIIDYLSMDIDTLSYECLMKLPFSKYKFGVITIEHDGYLYGDTHRKPQRNLLEKEGYKLLCGNVFVEQGGYQYGLPFEDWWVKPELFDNELLKRIECENKSPSEILSRF